MKEATSGCDGGEPHRDSLQIGCRTRPDGRSSDPSDKFQIGLRDMRTRPSQVGQAGWISPTFRAARDDHRVRHNHARSRDQESALARCRSCSAIVHSGTRQTDAGLRLIPISDDACEAVLELRKRAKTLGEPADRHFLFPVSSNGKIDPERGQMSCRTAWRSLTEAAGINGFRFHD